MSKNKRLAEAIDNLKTEMRKSGSLNQHVVLCMELDESGQPMSIASGSEGSSYSIYSMLSYMSETITEMKAHHKRLLDNSGEKTGSSSYNSPSSKEPDTDIMEIVAKYKVPLLEALLERDQDKIAKIKVQIIAEIKKVKGDDFDIGLFIPDDGIDEPKKPKDDGLGDFSKFF